MELLRWGSETQDFGFIIWVDRVNCHRREIESWCFERQLQPFIGAIRSDEELTLKTSAFNFSTAANLPYQLSWEIQIFYQCIKYCLHPMLHAGIRLGFIFPSSVEWHQAGSRSGQKFLIHWKWHQKHLDTRHLFHECQKNWDKGCELSSLLFACFCIFICNH